MTTHACPGPAARRLDIMRCAANAGSEVDLVTELAGVLRHHTGADACDILLREPGDTLVYVGSTDFPEYAGRIRLGPGVGVTGRCLVTGEPMAITEHLAQSPHFREAPGLHERQYESAYVTPLETGSERIGVLLLKRAIKWNPSRAEIATIHQAADETTLAICAWRNATRAALSSSRMGAVNEVARTIMSSPYLEEILQLLVHLTAQKFGYKVCTVRLLDEARGELVLRATQAPAKAYHRKRAIKLGESIAGRAISEGRPVIVKDVQKDESYIGHDLAAEQGLHSMICVPLVVQGRIVGVMSCYTGEERAFPPDEISALQELADQAAISIEHAKLQVRSTLLQEMHHRVKNSLQQIASLLRIQLRQSHYKSLEEALNDSLGRILAMASVHELLSREDLDHVGVRTMASALVQNHQQSLMSPNTMIAFDVRGDDVRLNMTQATQVALILNELIQNAVEHGFRNCEQGEIHITIEQRDRDVAIWVSNSGDRLPEGFDPNSGRMGMQIIASLVRSLGGSFLIEDRLGWTVAELRFVREGGE